MIKNKLRSHEPVLIDDYNQRVPQDQDVIGTVTTQFGNPAPRHGYKIAEPLRIPQATKQGYIEVPQGAAFDMSYPESTTRRGRVQEGGQVSPTLMAGGEAPCYYEGVEPEWRTIIGNKQMNPFRGKVDGCAPCVTSACGAGGGMTPMLTDADIETVKTEQFIEQIRGHEQLSYRIRKLTPRECFRLMGVEDKDIDTIQASGVSNSQQYKMAGNSIVVDCLYHLFRKMFTETQSEDRQLTLF
jgi:DNA (cytosine-5)-methyltransferase 1